MGRIDCTFNENGTIQVASIHSEENPAQTWAKLHHPSFRFSGGGSFDLVMTVPAADFRFSTSDPIDFGLSGQPSWITIETPLQSTELTLQIDSSTPGSSTFTVQNATQGGLSITMTVHSLGGSGGAGGTIDTYIGDAQTALVGPMPHGVVAEGTNIFFGFKESGENNLVFVLEEVEPEVHFPEGQPGFIDVITDDPSEIAFTIDVNTNSDPIDTPFTLDVGSVIFDPTIISNPDENGPLGNG